MGKALADESSSKIHLKERVLDSSGPFLDLLLRDCVTFLSMTITWLRNAAWKQQGVVWGIYRPLYCPKSTKKPSDKNNLKMCCPA